MAADEAGTLAALKALRRDFIEPKIAEHHGRIVKLMGDGALVEFASVVDAVRCAVELQEGMAERARDVPPDRQLRFRIGINLGDIIIEDDDIHGDGVNVAARLEALAEPGGICVSRTVRNHVQDKLPLRLRGSGRTDPQEHPAPGARVSRRAGWRHGCGREQGASPSSTGGCGPPRRRSCSWSPPAAPGCGCARTTARRQRRSRP